MVENLGCVSEAVSVGFSDTDIPAVHTYHNNYDWLRWSLSVGTIEEGRSLPTV